MRKYLGKTDKIRPFNIRKGDKDYERHKALTNVVSSTTYQIPKAYVLCNDNVKKVGKITYLPIYMLMFIKKGESVFYGLSFDCSLISGGRDYRKLFQLYVSKYPLAPYNGTLVISSCSR